MLRTGANNVTFPPGNRDRLNPKLVPELPLRQTEKLLTCFVDPIT